MSNGDLLVADQIIVTVYCTFVQNTCFWSAPAFNVAIGDYLFGIIPLQLSFVVKLITFRAVTSGGEVNKTGTNFRVPIWTLVTVWFAEADLAFGGQRLLRPKRVNLGKLVVASIATINHTELGSLLLASSSKNMKVDCVCRER